VSTASPARWLTRLSVAAACGVITLLALTFIVGSTPDEEEFRFAILSTWLHAGGLVHGRLELWTPLLGLGVPQPFTPSFLLHPLMPLAAAMSPVDWARMLLVAHMLFGAVGMWQLSRHLRMTAVTGALCVSTFLLATPAQNYALVDFWPSHFVVWTSAPWILLLAYRLIESQGRATAGWSVAFGLGVGLVLANTNPGHAVVYVAFGAAVVLVHWRQLLARKWWIGLSVLIAVALASPGLAELLNELHHFEPGLPVANAPAPLPVAQVWSVFFSPFGAVDEHWPFARTLFFGGPFAVLCIAGCVRMTRRHAEFVLTIGICAILLFTSIVPLSVVSARFHFRDPLTLAAILLAGVTLDRLVVASGRRRLATVVIVAQLCAIVAAAWPAIAHAWSPDARNAQWLRGGSGEAQSVEQLLKLLRPNGRLAFSPAVDMAVSDRKRLAEGLGVNALAYRGVPVVNGWFKGVSTDSVWPDERMFYGRTRVPPQLVESAASLDVLGIRYVLANDDEAVAPGLRRRGTVPMEVGAPLVVYENADAWPDAFVLDAAAEQSPLPTLAGCVNNRVLCEDLTSVAARQAVGSAVARQRGDEIDVRLFSASEPTLLVVSQMFRPDWRASSEDGSLTTAPVLGGLLGVRIPPGTTTVQLRYRPTLIIAATLLAWLTLAASLGAFFVLKFSRGASLDGSPREP
jgi:hypothetical protein